MAAMVVFMFTKAIGLFFPGSWNSNPGHKNAKSAVAIITAAQSIILIN